MLMQFFFVIWYSDKTVLVNCFIHMNALYKYILILKGLDFVRVRVQLHEIPRGPGILCSNQHGYFTF